MGPENSNGQRSDPDDQREMAAARTARLRQANLEIGIHNSEYGPDSGTRPARPKLTPTPSPNAMISRERRNNPSELADIDLGMSAHPIFMFKWLMAKTGSTLRLRRARPSNCGSATAVPAHIRPAKYLGALAATLIFSCLPVSAVAQEVCENEPFFSADIVYDRNGRPMVQAAFAGQDRYLILDTGGAKSILDAETARELALPIGQIGPVSGSPFDRGNSAPSEEYIDVTGRRSSSFVKVDDLQLGERNFGAFEFIVSPVGQNQDDRFGPVGTLGADFMIAYDVAFDFGADVFQLFAQSQCDSSLFLESTDAGTSIAVPFTFNRSNHIRFPLHLDGQMLMAILDTGAHDTILSLPVAQRVFSIDLNGPDVIQAGELEGRNITSMYRRRFSSLRIETLLLLNPMIFLFPDLMASPAPSPDRFSILRSAPEENAVLPDFILGMSVLSRYRLYISYGEREFYLAPVPSG